MKKLILIPITLFCCLLAEAQILRSFTVRYNNASVKGNIIQVANNIFTSVGGLSSGNPGNTTEAPPGGTSANNGTLGRNINIDALVPFGSSWKYFVSAVAPPGAAPAAGWNTLAFADGAWPSANAELGYGDADEQTCIPSRGGGTLCVPTGNKVTTSYFRKTINIANPSAFTSFTFRVERDDGYVLYVNGTEVNRNNMPVGAIVYTTFASADVNDAIITFTVPNTTFAAGNNVIAVEVHQQSLTNSDLSFNLELTALTGTSNDIFNSSTADLNLPTCTQVLFAGLYWGASQGTNGTNTAWIVNETLLKLKVPGSAVYQNITSTQTDYHNGTLVPGLPHTGYRCFVDITSLINSTNPNGTYGIANIAAPEAIINGCAGWTIVIAYADPATIVRNLTVFDGSAIMNGGDPPLDVPITGFLTPPTGPVSCELGAVVYDGDRVSVDAYKFKQDANPLIGTYTNLTPNTLSNLNDMWNSTISGYGVVVATRNPAHNNTLGYDADIIVVPNASNAVLGNNATSASIRFESPSENYFIHTVSTAVSQYTPTFNVLKSSLDLNAGILNPGDSIKYTIDFRNGGNDTSTATIITDYIPTGTSYAPNSLVINGVAKTDASGDDQAEYDLTNNRVIFRLGTGANGSSGGEIIPGAIGTVTFKVYAPSSCAIFSCNSTISNTARMNYKGKLSLLDLVDSSGVLTAGCNIPNPVSDIITGSCMPLADTILANICPSSNVTIPAARYGGYRFFTGTPFIPANLYNPSTPITFTRIIYAYFDGPGSCDDTIRINVFITSCPDIDDDNDGIPDYVELNNPVALQDADADGIPNWNDANYPGFIDNNSDGFNDNFDPSADSDNDGNPNFYDPNFPGWVDTNSDGINDNLDKDLDGIPNHLDLDSDNDGIPDCAESFGVDANGDGRIDNYTDIDNDGLSQNVDGSAGGVTGSGLALGALDTDADGIGNYLDKDSDNDGIPDNIEVLGTDSNNDGKQDSFSDSDGDGFCDAIDSDVGNDGTPENSSAALLRTSADGNGDGRTDSWPFKNSDTDSKPNPYDLDSDGDGISDVKEAQLTDTNWDGRVDGVLSSDGWNAAIAGQGSLSLPNTDGIGRQNPYDIDSDEDGIPDNVEGLTTNGYLLPAAVDTDLDGIDNSYDNFNGFGGDGIHPCDIDNDTQPDYLDLDTDSDGLIDRIEGNDLNHNGLPDDNVALTGIDTDSDGLDDRFDNNNSNAKVTSAYMGNGGSTSGDPSPGSITTVQHTAFPWGCATERDWRCIFYILSCDIISFKAVLQNQQVKLDWTVFCKQEVDQFFIQRSVDGISFTDIAMINGRAVINEADSYSAIDDITRVNSDFLYYRLLTIMKNGKRSISNVIIIRKKSNQDADVQVMPNPVRDQFQLLITTTTTAVAGIHFIDGNGRTLKTHKEQLQPGNNTYTYNWTTGLPSGLYYLRINLATEYFTRKIYIIK